MRRAYLILILVVAVALFWLRYGRVDKQVKRPARVDTAAPAAANNGAATAASGAAGRAAQAMPAAASSRFDEGARVVSAAWGSQPGQFGRRHDPESNPEAPMALAAGGGELLILDQVNRRIERYRGGERLGTVALGGDTLQDVTAGTQGRVVVLDRLVERNVAVYGADGRLENEIPIDAKLVGQGGALTGVFADRDGIYVERDHGVIIRIGDAAGNRDRGPEELPGRPTRDGQMYITAAIADRATGQVLVSAVHRLTQKPAFSVTAQLGAPILHLLLLDSDPQGRVYIAAATGNESPEPPYSILDEAIIALQLGSFGVTRGRLVLPPISAAEESFRPLSVDDEGSILLMRARPEGLLVTRHRFP
jgi:hypothetical protein